MAGNCPVCGKEMIEGCLVSCGTCETLHHRDCWEYNKGCATFGCKKDILPAKKSDLPDPRMESEKGELRSIWDWLVSLVYGSPEHRRANKLQIELNYALLRASESGNIEMMELLLKKGANPNFKHEFHCGTCLGGAIASKSLEAVNLLVDNGASLRNGHYLSSAAGSGKKEILDFLLKRIEQD